MPPVSADDRAVRRHDQVQTEVETDPGDDLFHVLPDRRSLLAKRVAGILGSQPMIRHHRALAAHARQYHLAAARPTRLGVWDNTADGDYKVGVEHSTMHFDRYTIAGLTGGHKCRRFLRRVVDNRKVQRDIATEL